MLSDDSDDESLNKLTINEHYAKAFEYRKEREELAKLKEKYGSDIDEDEEEDSEDAESEDEEGEELTPAVDVAILRTLARIKRKDPSIYEQGKDVFEEERSKIGDVQLGTKRTKDKSKPITMRQHALASALHPESRSPSPEPLTHFEEQQALRTETITAFHTAVADEDDEDDLLVPREKTKDELEREEEEYKAFLERQVGENIGDLIKLDESEASGSASADVKSEEKKKKKSGKKDKGGKSKEEDDHEFLMNYILNRGWIDRSAHRLPTYKEITSSKNGKRKRAADSDDSSASGSEPELNNGVQDEVDLSAEEEFDEVADRFESSYNFRFEEPDAATIARHPRNLPSLVRQQDTARKDAREKRKAKKEEELLKKKEEVKRLKALKMKELRAKLERIGREGGKSLEESRALQELDLDAEWDPEAHDRQMAELYENGPDADPAFIDEEKPTWDDDIDIGDIALPEEAEPSTKKSKKKKKKKDTEQMQDGVDEREMDADAEPLRGDDEEWDGTEEMRKKKLDEYMDEIYGLDFNDIVGDMPTRFKYAKVEPQTFALTPAEILMATDAELNTYMGIKKYAPYRKEGKGKTWDSNRAARLKELKDKLKERGMGEEPPKEVVKKRKGKKERQKEKAALAGTDAPVLMGDDRAGSAENPATNKKEKKTSRETEGEEHEGDDRPAKKRRRRHHKKSEEATAA